MKEQLLLFFSFLLLLWVFFMARTWLECAVQHKLISDSTGGSIFLPFHLTPFYLWLCLDLQSSASFIWAEMKVKKKRKEEHRIWWDKLWWNKTLSCLSDGAQTTVKTDGGPDTGLENNVTKCGNETSCFLRRGVDNGSARFCFLQCSQSHNLLLICSTVEMETSLRPLKGRVNSSMLDTHVWQKAPAVVSAELLIVRWL